jgi:hypothetical protein
VVWYKGTSGETKSWLTNQVVLTRARRQTPQIRAEEIAQYDVAEFSSHNLVVPLAYERSRFSWRGVSGNPRLK